jgi:hypothetical protein
MYVAGGVKPKAFQDYINGGAYGFVIGFDCLNYDIAQFEDDFKAINEAFIVASSKKNQNHLV